jgi:spore germination protein YaaH
MNDKPFTLSFPIEKQKDQVYVPVAPLQQLYQLELRESEETGAVVLHKQGDVIQWGRTVVASGKPDKTFALRKEASVKSPVYADVGADETVMIWEEKNGWYYIQLKNGTTGYMRKQDVALDTVETIPVKEAKAPYVPWKPTGNKINMTWEQIVTKSPDFSKIGPMPGLNVISPTWFHIADGQGNLQNLADPAYVKWANGREYQVWALFSNGFDPKRTSEALSTYDKRIFMIKQLLGFAQLYGLQGINIDFENVYLKDKAQLVQFVREMVPLLHEQGLVVSMDVTVKSTNENWSMFLDRKALIESLDYMMVMAYDEHWASSPKSGSVASLPWVERSLVQLMKEDSLPPSKLVLGVPLYTRIWTEETKDGKLSVTSRAVFMDSTPQIIKDKKLTPVYQEDTGQNYVEYREGGKLMRIWLEDETSMKARVELVRKYNLAGIASWRRGYENLPTWELIQSTLTKLP